LAVPAIWDSYTVVFNKAPDTAGAPSVGAVVSSCSGAPKRTRNDVELTTHARKPGLQISRFKFYPRRQKLWPTTRFAPRL